MPDPQTILLRADGNASMGIGHLMRCRALADALAKRGAKPIFACVEAPEAFRAESKYPVLRIAPEPEALVKLCAHHKASWVVFDGYHLDAAYRTAAGQGARQLVFDDLADNGPYETDILVNANPGRQEQDYYHVSPQTHMMIGRSFCLLRDEISRAEQRRSKSGPIEKLLISCGGADPRLAACAALSEIAYFDDAKLEVTVLAGAANPNIKQLEELAALNPHDVKVLQQSENMADSLNDCDAAIIGAGTTLWECAYLGVPTIALILADNQRVGALHFEETGGCVAVDWVPSFVPGEILTALKSWYDDPSLAQAVGQAAANLIDGKGAGRIAEAILA